MIHVALDCRICWTDADPLEVKHLINCHLMHGAIRRALSFGTIWTSLSLSTAVKVWLHQNYDVSYSPGHIASWSEFTGKHNYKNTFILENFEHRIDSMFQRSDAQLYLNLNLAILKTRNCLPCLQLE